MKIEVLISTMNLASEKDFLKLLSKINIKNNSLTINQVTSKNSNLLFNDSSNRLLSFKEKGLSKSRNRAIYNSNADICIIGDDDLKYVSNYEKIIKDAYKKYPDADIIAFDVTRNNSERKIHSLKEGRVKYLNILKIRSVQITFKKDSIIKSNLEFDEKFGSGSGKYDSGEESIFLTDARKKKLKIYYCKQNIATVNDTTSSWYKGIDELFLISKGAMFYRIFKYLYLPFILQFAIRKYKLYKNNFSFFMALKYMLNGKNELKKTNEDNKRIRVLMVGDFKSNTGPANVNKNFQLTLPKNTLYTVRNNKLSRILEILIKIIFVDAVCFCSFSKLNLFAIKLAKILGKNTFYIMHGYIKKEQEINGIINVEKEKNEEYILNNVDLVFCVSATLCQYMKQFNYKSRFDYIYNGINWNNIKGKCKEKKKFQIMSTGGGMPRKNNLIICEAINRLDQKLKDKITYVVVGDSYKQKGKFLKYPFVKYYDNLSYQQCLDMMAESYLYIQNSLFETFGLAIVEALANGCNLLISKHVGSLGILKTEDVDIINNCSNLDEIARKIAYLLENGNNERILKSINKDETSIKYRSQELYSKIKEEVLNSYKEDK